MHDSASVHQGFVYATKNRPERRPRRLQEAPKEPPRGPENKIPEIRKRHRGPPRWSKVSPRGPSACHCLPPPPFPLPSPLSSISLYPSLSSTFLLSSSLSSPIPFSYGSASPRRVRARSRSRIYGSWCFESGRGLGHWTWGKRCKRWGTVALACSAAITSNALLLQATLLPCFIMHVQHI